MSNNGNISSRFIVTIEGDTLTDSLIQAVSNWGISTFLIEKENIKDKEHISSLLKKITQVVNEKVKKEPFFILNYTQECASLLNTFMSPIPSPLALSATMDEGNAFSIGKLHALELKELGFDAILGPSLELHTHTLNRDDGDMSFGNLNDIVSRFGIAMSNGYIEGGILPILHHFPGKSGLYHEDDCGIGINDKSLEELQEGELYPFERAIEKEAKALLVAPHYYKAFSNEMKVGSMEKSLISDYLRDELHFKGLVIASQVDKESISNHLPIELVAIESLLSGCDQIIISHRVEHIEKIYNSTQQALSSAYLSQEQHQNHLDNIKRTLIKSKKTPFDPTSHLAIVNAIVERSITLLRAQDEKLPDIGDNPIFLSKRVDDGDGRESFAAWMKRHLGGEAFEFTSNIESSEINHLLEEASDNSSIIIALKDGYAHPAELALANSLGATGIPTIVVSLKDPYDALFIQPSIFTIAIYEESVVAFEGLRKVLLKERNATGSISIHW